jgi:hypothetical protein
MGPGEFLDRFGSAVGAVIVYNDQFPGHCGQRLAEIFNQKGNIAVLIERGHDHAENRGRQSGGGSTADLARNSSQNHPPATCLPIKTNAHSRSASPRPAQPGNASC